jgi:hypothetical protein
VNGEYPPDISFLEIQILFVLIENIPLATPILGIKIKFKKASEV